MRFLFRVFLLGPLFSHLVLLITSHWHLSSHWSLDLYFLLFYMANRVFPNVPSLDSTNETSAPLTRPFLSMPLSDGKHLHSTIFFYSFSWVYYFVFIFIFSSHSIRKQNAMMIQLDVWKEKSFLNSKFWVISIHISDLPILLSSVMFLIS